MCPTNNNEASPCSLNKIETPLVVKLVRRPVHFSIILFKVLKSILIDPSNTNEKRRAIVCVPPYRP
jgi:hypothetical protein